MVVVLGDLIGPHRRVVQLEPETGSIRGDELAALEPRHGSEDAGRSRHVFHQVSVGNGAQQVHLDLGDDVPTHRNTIRLRERGDLAPRRHATDSGQIENEDIDGLSFQELPEGVEVIQVLAGGNRDFEPATKLGEPDDVLMVDGIFDTRSPRPGARDPYGAPGPETSSRSRPP